MGELVDAWIAQGKKNVWGNPVHLKMLQSEGGACGAVHGAAAAGTLATTFTASQGLLLMIPDLYKIAAEYCPAVVHVAARSLALGGLSIYNDHGDIYAARSTGMPMLCSNGVQEAHDLSAVAHLTTIRTGLPFVHFFDGFRTSHEINTYEEIPYDTLRKLVDLDGIAKIRAKAMNPEHPVLRGTIVGPEYVFQSVEKPTKAYATLDAEVEKTMDQLGALTGRKYKPVEYVGTQEDEYAIVAMGSGCDTIQEFIDTHPGSKIGLLKIHLYRPFRAERILAALPKSVKRVCVLDKVRDIVGVREPLYLDVCAALQNHRQVELIGGRYGIGSKDFAPQHVTAIADNLKKTVPKDGFTVGVADVTTQLPVGAPTDHLPPSTRQCLFWGLGADGTVGANKDAIKLIVDNTDLYGQAYFAYDAHKSGGLTTSHVRFGKEPINAPYYVQQADYIACHNPAYLSKFDTISSLKKGGVFVANVPEGTNFDEILPAAQRKKLAELDAKIYYLDATKLSYDLGMPGRINMFMQTVFFELSGVLPREKYVALLKKAIAKTYAKKGKEAIEKNWGAVDHALEHMKELKYDKAAWLALKPAPEVPKTGFDKIIQYSIENRGDEITTDEISEYASVPAGTSKYEKRGIGVTVPVWDQQKCFQCNLCSVLCPHGVIRPFLLTEAETSQAVKTSGVVAAKGKEFAGLNLKIAISPLDCTGCGVCAGACPAKALKLVPVGKVLDTGAQELFDELVKVPIKSGLISEKTVKGSQFLQPLLEFNGACQGCGEPAIFKLISQLYGSESYIACATGCSLVWGATYPFNPWTTDKNGYGPSWANSLFEDNAEFGYGISNAVLARRNNTKKLVQELVAGSELTGALKDKLQALLAVWDDKKKSLAVSLEIKPLLAAIGQPASAKIRQLQTQADMLAAKTVWIQCGDGAAYDINYGGLDHVLASGENVNVVVLDTEVYSNTGGQSSKATQRGAIASFAAAGYAKAKKDLAAISITYGNIYVASTCLLADPAQALKAVTEAEEYNGPSLIINYSPCINHGIKKGLGTGPAQCKALVKAGYVLLFRYDPRKAAAGQTPLTLDSKAPDFDIGALLKGENRFAALLDLYPAEAKVKNPALIEDLKRRYEFYARLAGGK